jgi:uncharacterized protein (TIGR03118 family)
MTFLSLFRKKRAAPDRRRLYRPVLEGLEDRCLLSGGFGQVNLASDVPGLARVTDPNLVNPWGMAFSPTGPFWFADAGSGVSDLLDGRGRPVPLVVAVPPATRWGSTPTGTVFNGGAGFAVSEHGVSAPSRFLFATQQGTIAGWTGVVDPTRALLAVDNSSSGAEYTGLALAADAAGHSFLYAADFSRGTIDVFDQGFRPVVRPGAFQDPNLPGGYAPFNIQNINDLLFVTYAQRDTNGRDDVTGAGHGFIDVYNTDGSLVGRFASQGALDSPWGLALAPAGFGPFGGALLVGNNGDGRINAYDPRSGAFLGQLANRNGVPIAIPNLWSLTFGNGHAGGDAQTLFFAAGLDNDEHGLFGAIQAPGRRGADTAGSGTFDPHAPGEPGDYPLPPSGGPAFRTGGEDVPVPVSDLLPLAESSLAVAPTLSSTAQPGTGIAPPGPAAQAVGASLGGSALTPVPTSSTILLAPAGGDSRPAGGAPNGAVTLNAFLDLNASPTVSQQKPAMQPSDTDLDAAGAHALLPANRDAGAEGLLSERPVEEQEAQSSEELVAEALPPSGQAYEGIAEAPSQGRPGSAEERAPGNEGAEVQKRRGWTNLVYLLFVAGIPVIWAYWAGHEMRSLRSSGSGKGEGSKGKASRLFPWRRFCAGAKDRAPSSDPMASGKPSRCAFTGRG